MIRVSHLTKKYGAFTAVDDVSFSVEPGEIVGFLGPNGAGKTTSMRILAGFIPATGGVVEVAGHDVTTQSLKVRKRIGYLPEKNPLYPDMRVNEYLSYRARLKGVRRSQLRERLQTVREQCGLQEVGGKIIATLSKGFQQRVGLADALVHNPDLLILDEPTQGLDPNQIRHVRKLIRDLGKRHTILLSTHILSEVEMTCQKVIIINSGKIIASDTMAGLRETWCGQPHLVAEIQGPRGSVVERVLALDGVGRVKVESDDAPWCSLRIAGTNGSAKLAEAVFDLVRDQSWKLRRLEHEQRTLEDVFVEVTNGDSEGAMSRSPEMRSVPATAPETKSEAPAP